MAIAVTDLAVGQLTLKLRDGEISSLIKGTVVSRG